MTKKFKLEREHNALRFTKRFIVRKPISYEISKA